MALHMLWMGDVEGIRIDYLACATSPLDPRPIVSGNLSNVEGIPLGSDHDCERPHPIFSSVDLEEGFVWKQVKLDACLHPPVDPQSEPPLSEDEALTNYLSAAVNGCS